MTDFTCTNCGAWVTGIPFGARGEELCQNCWFGKPEQPERAGGAFLIEPRSPAQAEDARILAEWFREDRDARELAAWKASGHRKESKP